jgi:carbonic anhydrase
MEIAMKMPVDLRDGYRRFRDFRLEQEAERYRSLAQEQKPSTMVIGCADSRVDPSTIFGAAPGELFVVRNIAALVPPFEETGTYHGTSAAIEFAVTALKVDNIVVLGHGMCGGIAASLAVAESRPVGRFVKPWVELIGALRDELVDRIPASQPEQRQRALERMAIQQSIENLQTFPFVAEAVDGGSLELHGAWFSIADAELQWLDWDSGVFEPIESKPNHETPN